MDDRSDALIMEKTGDEGCTNENEAGDDQTDAEVEPEDDVGAFLHPVLALDERLGETGIGKHLREADDDRGCGDHAEILRYQ